MYGQFSRISQWRFVNSRRHRKKTKIGRVQLQKVQKNTKHVSFRLYAFVKYKNKNNKPLMGIHIHTFEVKTVKKKKKEKEKEKYIYIYIYIYICVCVCI